MSFHNLPIYIDEFRKESSNSTLNPQPPTLSMHPDPTKSAPFNLAGHLGRVIPLFLDPTIPRYHSRQFHVEFPVDSGILHHIDAARMVSVIGDGGTQRHFSAPEVARILSGLSPKLNHQKFLHAVSV